MRTAPMMQVTSVPTPPGPATASGELGLRVAEGEAHAPTGPDSAGRNPGPDPQDAPGPAASPSLPARPWPTDS